MSDPFAKTQPREIAAPQAEEAPAVPPPLSAHHPGQAGGALPAPQPFTFTGSGSEYFRIWIVNLLLTIVTVGIYSAWAKVRKLKYFYNNTQVAGESFEYHGKPAAILKGRLIAFGLFGAYNLAFKVSPFLGFAAMALLALVMPWLLWKSFQFKLYNSSYRGLRFGFSGSAKGAYFVFLLLPVAMVFAIGVLFGVAIPAISATRSVFLGVIVAAVLAGMMVLFYPLIHHRLKAYQHGNSRYGAAQFSFNATLIQFVKAYLLTGLLLIAGMVAVGLFFGATMFAEMKNARGGPPASLFIVVLLFYGLLFAIGPILGAMLQNVIWNRTQLEQHQFVSKLSIGKAAWVAVSNVIGVICTLGLFLPFAQVRAAKLKLEALTLQPASDLESFAAAQQQQAAATGEGMADLMDFDIGL
jgi:uncharacterized membrane protein YjgN (DUF898 family)